MSKCVNKVILMGHAGKDPQVHILPSGTLVNLSLATSERFKDTRGEWQERTEWHNLVGLQRIGEILRDYVRKGSRITSRAPSAPAPGRIGSQGSAGIARKWSWRMSTCYLRPSLRTVRANRSTMPPGTASCRKSSAANRKSRATKFLIRSRRLGRS